MKLLNKTLASLLFLITPASAYVPLPSNVIEDYVYMQERNYIIDAKTGNLRMDVMIYWDRCQCNRTNAPKEEHLRVVDWLDTFQSCPPSFDSKLKKYVAEFKGKDHISRRIIRTYFDRSCTEYDKELKDRNIHPEIDRRKLRNK